MNLMEGRTLTMSRTLQMPRQVYIDYMITN